MLIQKKEIEGMGEKQKNWIVICIDVIFLGNESFQKKLVVEN